MHTLYFVRLIAKQQSQVVFLFTAESEEQAEAKGLSLIADQYRAEFWVDKCEAVCKTPDEVECYEPV